jgi:hypothetical protein
MKSDILKITPHTQTQWDKMVAMANKHLHTPLGCFEDLLLVQMGIYVKSLQERMAAKNVAA